MAATHLGRVYQTSVNEDFDTRTLIVVRSYTTVHLVQTTSDCDDEQYVLEADGLPRLGEYSTVVPQTVVVGRSASESSDGSGIWTVTVNWSTPEKIEGDGEGGNGPGGGGESSVGDPDTPPWERPWVYNYSTMRKQSLKTRMIYLGAYADETEGPFTPTVFPWTDGTKVAKDPFGSPLIPVTNSAGEPIYYDGERVLQVVSIESAHSSGEYPALWYKLAGTVNNNKCFAGPFAGIVDRGKLLCEEASPSLDWWTSPSGSLKRYYKLQRKIVIDPLGHWQEFADVGSLYFSGGARSVNDDLSDSEAAVGPDGNRTVFNLNGSGGKAEDGSAPLFLRYVEHPLADWEM